MANSADICVRAVSMSVQARLVRTPGVRPLKREVSRRNEAQIWPLRTEMSARPYRSPNSISSVRPPPFCAGPPGAPVGVGTD